MLPSDPDPSPLQVDSHLMFGGSSQHNLTSESLTLIIIIINCNVLMFSGDILHFSSCRMMCEVQTSIYSGVSGVRGHDLVYQFYCLVDIHCSRYQRDGERQKPCSYVERITVTDSRKRFRCNFTTGNSLCGYELQGRSVGTGRLPALFSDCGRELVASD